MKELWRDGKGRGLSELVGWVRHLSQCWREFVPERRPGGAATAMERLENLSDEVTEGRSSVRVLYLSICKTSLTEPDRLAEL